MCCTDTSTCDFRKELLEETSLVPFLFKCAFSDYTQPSADPAWPSKYGVKLLPPQCACALALAVTLKKDFGQDQLLQRP